MAEELQKYKDILKCEREEFKKKTAEEGSKYLLVLFLNESSKQSFRIEWNWNFSNKFSQNYYLISFPNFKV